VGFSARADTAADSVIVPNACIVLLVPERLHLGLGEIAIAKQRESHQVAGRCAGAGTEYGAGAGAEDIPGACNGAGTDTDMVGAGAGNGTGAGDGIGTGNGAGNFDGDGTGAGDDNGLALALALVLAMAWHWRAVAPNVVAQVSATWRKRVGIRAAFEVLLLCCAIKWQHFWMNDVLFMRALRGFWMCQK
jgi:hypothetical protein